MRRLFSPETARRGNVYGIAGMAIAVVTTFALPQVENYGLIIFGIMVGGIIGSVIARRIQMTASASAPSCTLAKPTYNIHRCAGISRGERRNASLT